MYYFSKIEFPCGLKTQTEVKNWFGIGYVDEIKSIPKLICPMHKDKCSNATVTKKK